MLGSAGFDFLIVDTEHAPYSLHQLQTVLITLQRLCDAVFVRTAWNDHVLIKQVLDIGARALIVPGVSTAEDCARAVTSSRYPPVGSRGFGPRRAARISGGASSYIAYANSELPVFVMIEDATAVENIDSILEVNGMSGVMVGPADLSASLGYLNQVDHPEVEAAIHRVLDSCQSHSLPFGMFTTTAERARKWASAGAQLVTVGGDTAFLDSGIAAAQRAIAEIREMRPKPFSNPSTSY
jgi:2-keto-3-deoxy-L-rhamnonate aldolase RhmA